MADTSKSGVFFDLKAQKVVNSQPEEGVQIVAPGAEITPSLQEDIDRYKAVENGDEASPETVTTARATGRK